MAALEANGDTSGFVKYIADAKTDEVLGVHMIGAGVSELIAESVVALEFAASSEDMGMISRPHPTLSEGEQGGRLGGSEKGMESLKTAGFLVDYCAFPVRLASLPD